MKYPIDLGKTSGDLGVVAPVTKTQSPSEKYYPTLYLQWDSNYELPESGSMTVTFKRKQQTEKTTDAGTSYSVDLEIRSIEGVKADASAGGPNKKSVGDILDMLRAEVESDNEY